MPAGPDKCNSLPDASIEALQDPLADWSGSRQPMESLSG
jgi:hypothetical protein